jgi:hypothetical protein
MFKRPSKAESHSVKLYQSIHDLPMHRFIECITEDNYPTLIIEGKPTDEELQAHWLKIADQYTAAVGDHEYRLYLNCFVEMAAMAVDLQNIEFLIESLSKAFYQPLLEELNKLMGTKIVLDGLEKPAYYKQLDVLYKRSRGLKIKLDLKRMQYEAIGKKFQGVSEKPTREYFESMLITLSDHAQFQLTLNISVFEYCERLKRFIRYIEQAKKKWQK